MGAGYFIIAILGCGDGAAACTPVATMPTRYESEEQCAAATAETLMANTDFDFPSLVAECRAMKRPASASQEQRETEMPTQGRKA